MTPLQASRFIIECGAMTGGSKPEQKNELELIKATVPFFGINPSIPQTFYLRLRLSDGNKEYFALTKRGDNDMWRIAFSKSVPEIRRGIFPAIQPGEPVRSDHAALFVKGDNDLSVFASVVFIPIDSNQYRTEMRHCADLDQKRRSRSSHTTQPREYGWR